MNFPFIWDNKVGRTFVRFVTIHSCDGQTDRRTALRSRRPRLHIMQRGKNVEVRCIATWGRPMSRQSFWLKLCWNLVGWRIMMHQPTKFQHNLTMNDWVIDDSTFPPVSEGSQWVGSQSWVKLHPHCKFAEQRQNNHRRSQVRCRFPFCCQTRRLKGVEKSKQNFALFHSRVKSRGVMGKTSEWIFHP